MPDPLNAATDPSIDALVRQINLKEKDPNGIRLRQASIVSVESDGTVTLLLSGSQTPVPGARFMGGNRPLPGSGVWCLRNGPDVIVLGALEKGSTTVQVVGDRFTAGNWYRLALTVGGDPAGTNDTTKASSNGLLPDTSNAPRAHARFSLADTIPGRHQRVEFGAGISYGRASQAYISTIFSTSYGGGLFSKARLVYKGTYDRSYLDVYCGITGANGGVVRASMYENDWPVGWQFDPGFSSGVATPATPTNAYLTREWLFADEGDSWNALTLLNGWTPYNNGYQVPQWRYGTDGRVEVRGVIAHATLTSATVFANFGPGTRPTVKTPLPLAPASGPGAARVEIRDTGDLAVAGYVAGGTAAYVTLSGLAWRPDK